MIVSIAKLLPLGLIPWAVFAVLALWPAGEPPLSARTALALGNFAGGGMTLSWGDGLAGLAIAALIVESIRLARVWVVHIFGGLIGAVAVLVSIPLILLHPAFFTPAFFVILAALVGHVALELFTRVVSARRDIGWLEGEGGPPDAPMAHPTRRSAAKRLRVKSGRGQAAARIVVEAKKADSALTGAAAPKAPAAPASRRDSPQPAFGSPAPERASVSAFSPQAVRPGARFLVQAFLHTPMQSDAVKAMAAERDPKARRRGIAGLNQFVSMGDSVRVTLEARGLKVKTPAQTLTWNGSPIDAGFEVVAPRWRRPDDYTLTLRVEVNGTPAARLSFQLSVDPKASRSASADPLPAFTPYRYVFFSYASEDRVKVLARAQMLERLGVAFFQDIVSLRAGDAWEPALAEHMGKADLVLLFWSKASAKSDWVRREIEWALDLRARSAEALPEITPVILDGPPPPRPPNSLKDIHFNDPIRCIQAAYERA